jgi:hypothetical protein
MHQEVHRSRHAIHRVIKALQRPKRPESTRSPLRLSLVEREEISRGLASGESLRGIARQLGRAPSTISSEVKANHGAGRYRACGADKRAWRQTKRPKQAKLTGCARLRDEVEAKLEVRWSPQQISGWLVEEYPSDPEMRVSHETIYLSLFVQSRGSLRKELTRYLRTGHATRRPLGHSSMHGQQLRFHRHHSLRHAQWATWRQIECQRSPASDLSVISRYSTAALGNAAQTRTPTGSCASASPSEATSESIPKPTSTLWPPSSMTALDKTFDRSHHVRHWTKRCVDPLRPQALSTGDTRPD